LSLNGKRSVRGTLPAALIIGGTAITLIKPRNRLGA
jgi:hypothetical protein